MPEPLFRFPVVCPICRAEEQSALPVAFVAGALIDGSVIQLYASCHDVYWDAQPGEVARLREYLALALSAPKSTNAT
jgi:hypothetical protein